MLSHHNGIHCLTFISPYTTMKSNQNELNGNTFDAIDCKRTCAEDYGQLKEHANYSHAQRK